MKYFLLSYVVLSVGIVTSTDPKDICDTCVLKEKCQVYGNMNNDEQKAWLEKYPCTSPEQSSLGSPPGFAVAARGDYVCCSNKIWGSTSETEQSPQELSQKLTPNKFANSEYDNDNFGNYNRHNYYSNAPRPNARNFNPYPNNQYYPNRPNENSNRDQNFNKGNNRGSNSNSSPNDGKKNWNDRPNNRNNWWNSRNQNNNNRPGNVPGTGNFNNNNRQTTLPSINSNGNNSQGNSFTKFGQCDRVTSLPPDPQSGCCGREASDDDRITEPNAPTDIGYPPIDVNGPNGVGSSQVNTGPPGPPTFNNVPANVQNGPPNIVFLPNDVNNAPRVIDNGFGNVNVPINPGFAPNTPIINGYPPTNNEPIDIGYHNAPIFGHAPFYGGSSENNYNIPEENNDWQSWMLKDKAQRRKRDDGNGTVEVEIENRISGGRETELYQFPWTVLLVTIFDYGTRQTAFNCGGSLISSTFVLTAGHCVFDKEGVIKNVEIYLAEYDKRTFPRDCKVTAHGRKCVDNIVMYAENVIRHPQYDDDGLQNDIALIKLRGNAPYTDYIRPICLTSINIDEPEYSNLRLTVAGWGRDGPYRTDVKQSTVVNLVPQNDCKIYYPRLNTRHLCAAGHRGEDSCKGDSGGPLMTLYRGKYYVVGVVSGKRSDTPCGTAVPSLYTNVYHYLDWIKTNVRN